MNYSPDNQQGLLALVEALRNGMDPSTAYTVGSNLQAQQAQQVAQRQDRLSGLADLLMGAAGQGVTYEGANALMEAQPGPAGPAAQNILSSLYPGSPESAPVVTQSGQQLGGQEPSGVAPMPTTQSPVFQPPPPPQPSVSDMATMQGLENQQTLATASPDLTSDAAKYARAGKTMAEFIPVAMQAYPEFFQTPEGTQLFQSIVQTAFAGQAATASG